MTSDASSISLVSTLRLLSAVSAPGVLVHVGAGGTGDEKLYSAASPENIVLIEAQADLAERLSDSYSDRSDIVVEQRVLGAEPGVATFHDASFNAESGLLPPQELMSIWKNIDCNSTSSVDVETLEGLSSSAYSVSKLLEQANWLVVDCFPSIDIFRSAGPKLISKLEVVVLRTLKSASNSDDAPSPFDGSRRETVTEEMSKIGFRLVSCHETRHPEIGACVFVRDMRQALIEARQQHDELRLLRQNLDQAREDHRSIAAAFDQQSEWVAAAKSEIDKIIKSSTTTKRTSAASRKQSASKKTTRKSDDA